VAGWLPTLDLDDRRGVRRGEAGVTALLEPDAEQLGEQTARRMLEQAGRYVREALALPEQVEVLQSITANLLFENATLRHQVDRLAERVERLERRAGGDR
jgi:ubiquinone biosynthesis protein UbiJ